jgi:hypothetical protein
MSEQPLTAAVIMAYTQELETRSARFYETLAGRFVAHQAIFAEFARDCQKNGTQVLRTYQETISDALEAGFSFEGASLPDYQAEVSLPEGISLSGAVGQALALEEQAIAFYLDVAERSASLLATIPRVFRRVARTRQRRRERLASL